MTTQHGIAASSIRSKYLKDLFVQWRGLTAGYDEGLAKGDAVLATAIWRNVFKGDGDVDFRSIGQVVNYMRSVLLRLEGTNDEDIVAGEVEFGNASNTAENGVAKQLHEEPSRYREENESSS